MIKINTDRLLLKDVISKDANYIFKEVDDKLMEHWIGLEPQSLKETRISIKKSIEKSKEELHLNLAVFTKINDEFIGCCGISKTDYNDFEINVWIKYSAQNKGYATEITKALIDWSKKNTELNYLVYSVTEGNGASEHIAKKIGAIPFRKWTENKRGRSRHIQDYKIALD